MGAGHEGHEAGPLGRSPRLGAAGERGRLGESHPQVAALPGAAGRGAGWQAGAADHRPFVAPRPAGQDLDRRLGRVRDRDAEARLGLRRRGVQRRAGPGPRGRRLALRGLAQLPRGRRLAASGPVPAPGRGDGAGGPLAGPRRQGLLRARAAPGAGRRSGGPGLCPRARQNLGHRSGLLWTGRAGPADRRRRVAGRGRRSGRGVARGDAVDRLGVEPQPMPAGLGGLGRGGQAVRGRAGERARRLGLRSLDRRPCQRRGLCGLARLPAQQLRRLSPPSRGRGRLGHGNAAHQGTDHRPPRGTHRAGRRVVAGL